MATTSTCQAGRDLRGLHLGDRELEFHRCRTCGCVSHWAALDRSYDRMGVNARLMPPGVLARARVRRLDGAVMERHLDE